MGLIDKKIRDINTKIESLKHDDPDNPKDVKNLWADRDKIHHLTLEVAGLEFEKKNLKRFFMEVCI